MKKFIKALLPFIFAIALASFSLRILELIGIPENGWFFVVFVAIAALVIDNKEKIFK